MKPTNLSLPAELQAALFTIATKGHEPIPLRDSLQAALDWQKSRLRQPMPNQVMDYEQAKEIFYGYWKNHLLPGEKFAINQGNKIHAANIIKWIIFDPTSGIPLPKSIWLYGLVGSGKSILAKVVHDFVDYLHEFVSSKINWEYYDFNLLIPRAKSDYSALDGLNVHKSLILDELKEEYCFVRLKYGLEFKIGELISTLYSVWQDKNVRTLITTNLPPQQKIKNEQGAEFQIFDDREFDRLIEMYTSVKWEGTSLRKSK